MSRNGSFDSENPGQYPFRPKYRSTLQRHRNKIPSFAVEGTQSAVPNPHSTASPGTRIRGFLRKNASPGKNGNHEFD